ncbi:MAG: nitrile hydratase accessory protein [bacterium]
MNKLAKPSIDIEGPAAPPRSNGELVFKEPWEGRAFGLAVALRDEGCFPWEAFRDRLVAAIAAADRRPSDQNKPAYYENWLAALERLLVANGLVTINEIDRRARQFATGERDIVNPGAHSMRPEED